MKHGLAHRRSTARLQRGFALIAILALAALISAFLIASALNRSSADVSNEREQRSMDALRQAKAALIAYAASEEWQLYKGQTPNQPGGLPCPDTGPDTTPANTGVSSGICSGALQRVGRLPFATIGADDLRDASGERLWYAVSSNFYKNASNVINSDTQGLLTVQGSAPANSVVAIVFAPGPAVQDSTLPGQIQDRSAANYNRIASYLENYTVGASDYTFWSSAFPSDTFNDRLLVITQAELMAAVEPVVAARIARDIGPLIQGYFTTWNNAYPFAAPFVAGGNGPGRAQAQYQGVAGQTNGLMPITNAPGWLTWNTSSISIAQICGGTGSGACTPPSGPPPSTISGVDCSNSTPSQIKCRIDYGGSDTDRPAIQLSAVLQNAALSFPKPLNAAFDPSQTDDDGNPLQSDPSNVTGQWSWSTPLFVPNAAFFPSSDGSAQVVLRARLQNPAEPPDGTGGRVTITINVPPYDVITSSNPAVNPNGAWFIANQWYRQTYFALSPGFVPGASPPATCNPLPATPSCLTVNNLPSPSTKQAILVLAGRALNGANRPTTNAADYFENANLTAANGTTPYVYENRSGVPTSINDRVVVLSP